MTVDVERLVECLRDEAAHQFSMSKGNLAVGGVIDEAVAKALEAVADCVERAADLDGRR